MVFICRFNNMGSIPIKCGLYRQVVFTDRSDCRIHLFTPRIMLGFHHVYTLITCASSLKSDKRRCNRQIYSQMWSNNPATHTSVESWQLAGCLTESIMEHSLMMFRFSLQTIYVDRLFSRTDMLRVRCILSMDVYYSHTCSKDHLHIKATCW